MPTRRWKPLPKNRSSASFSCQRCFAHSGRRISDASETKIMSSRFNINLASVPSFFTV